MGGVQIVLNTEIRVITGNVQVDDHVFFIGTGHHALYAAMYSAQAIVILESLRHRRRRERAFGLHHGGAPELIEYLLKLRTLEPHIREYQRCQWDAYVQCLLRAAIVVNCGETGHL